MLSVEQGGIKYHFLSLWYNSTWDWTPVSRVIGEHFTTKPMGWSRKWINEKRSPEKKNECFLILKWKKKWKSANIFECWKRFFNERLENLKKTHHI